MQLNCFEEVIFHLCKHQVDGEFKLVAKEKDHLEFPPSCKPA